MPKDMQSLRDMATGELRTRLDYIWQKGKEEYHECQKGDNIQGYEHGTAVDINLKRLILNKSLTQSSLFILSASACLHDVAKVVKDCHPGWKINHGERSSQIILNNYSDLGG